MGCIYKISAPSGNFYIGSAKDIKHRRRVHLHGLRNGKHHCKPLQDAFNKYGVGGLSFEPLASCPNEYLIRLEQWFIDNLKPAYNAAKVAGSRLGVKQSAATIEKLRINSTGRKVSEAYKARLRVELKGNTRQTGNRNKRKVTPAIVARVGELRAQGMGCRKISKELTLNKTTILNIFNQKFNYG